MNEINEIRSFLLILSSGSARCTRLPPVLLRLATRVVHGDREGAQDLVGDVLVDLLQRRGQAGSIERLLELGDAELWAALRCRLVQVRATQLGSKWRLMKTLRAQVAAALDLELPPPEALPLSLMAGGRLCGQSVHEAVAWLLDQAEAPARDPKALAAELLALYFAGRPDDLGGDAHGQVDVGHEDEVVRQLDAERHADRLRDRLGPDLTRLVHLRLKGQKLKEMAAGRVAVSTVHDQLRKAFARIREHAQEYGLSLEDVGSDLRAIAA